MDRLVYLSPLHPSTSVFAQQLPRSPLGDAPTPVLGVLGRCLASVPSRNMSWGAGELPVLGAEPQALGFQEAPPLDKTHRHVPTSGGSGRWSAGARAREREKSILTSTTTVEHDSI